MTPDLCCYKPVRGEWSDAPEREVRSLQKRTPLQRRLRKPVIKENFEGSLTSCFALLSDMTEMMVQVSNKTIETLQIHYKIRKEMKGQINVAFTQGMIWLIAIQNSQADH